MEQVIGPFIDGATVEADGSDAVEVVNPSTGRLLFEIPKGNEADVRRAVSSARDAFNDGRWSEASLSFRKQALYRFANLVSENAAQLDLLDAIEMGKPISVAFCNADSAADLTRFYAESIDKVHGDSYASDKHSVVFQRRVPRGVVAAVVPWNFPTFCALLKVAPALAAGNCVVLKPSELSSRSAIRLAHLAIQAGLPPGVFNVVPGMGATVGRALGLHTDIDMLTFTGSTKVGKKILEYSGQSNLKHVMVECGGKSPQIVFDDGVDLDAASQNISAFLLTNQGQICSVGSRVLVQQSIEAPLVKRISEQLAKITMGDASNPETSFGPLASAMQQTRVLQYIESAHSEGARLASGGKRALDESGGYFVEPTLFHSVLPTSRIAQEEVFGPVLSAIPFKDEDEAIRIANGTAYGLSAYVWTANLSTGLRLSKAIRSTVMVNAAAPKGEGAGFATSHEPAGQSGFGAEGGLAGLESYLRRQLVCFNHT